MLRLWKTNGRRFTTRQQFELSNFESQVSLSRVGLTLYYVRTSAFSDNCRLNVIYSRNLHCCIDYSCLLRLSRSLRVSRYCGWEDKQSKELKPQLRSFIEGATKSLTSLISSNSAPNSFNCVRLCHVRKSRLEVTRVLKVGLLLASLPLMDVG